MIRLIPRDDKFDIQNQYKMWLKMKDDMIISENYNGQQVREST